MVSFFYPSYLSRVFLPSWQVVSGLAIYITLILGLIFYLLNRWFILRDTRERPLSPFGRPKKLRMSTILFRALTKVRYEYLPALMLILIIALSVALDTTYPLFTPKLVQTLHQDKYYYQSPYVYPYDYLLVLSPDRYGNLSGASYSFYNFTVESIPALFPAETCVAYDNPAGATHLVTASSSSYGPYLYQNYLSNVYTNSTILTPIGNQTYTEEIQQCSAGKVNFYFWKEAPMAPIRTTDRCTYSDYVRTDNVTIENGAHLRIYVGLIIVHYLYRGSPVHVSVVMNGLNRTGAMVVQGPFSGELATISPISTIGGQAANPFSGERFSIVLTYNGTYSPGCHVG